MHMRHGPARCHCSPQGGSRQPVSHSLHTCTPALQSLQSSCGESAVCCSFSDSVLPMIALFSHSDMGRHGVQRCRALTILRAARCSKRRKAPARSCLAAGLAVPSSRWLQLQPRWRSWRWRSWHAPVRGARAAHNAAKPKTAPHRMQRRQMVQNSVAAAATQSSLRRSRQCMTPHRGAFRSTHTRRSWMIAGKSCAPARRCRLRMACTLDRMGKACASIGCTAGLSAMQGYQLRRRQAKRMCQRQMSCPARTAFEIQFARITNGKITSLQSFGWRLRAVAGSSMPLLQRSREAD